MAQDGGQDNMTMRQNPYLNRSMIREIADFYGRQREIEQVLARIGAWPPQSVAIVGDRRIGKSSLLWHLARPEIYNRYLTGPERYGFLYLDGQGYQSLDRDGFWAVVGEHLQRAVGSRLTLPAVHTGVEVERVIRTMEQADLRVVCLVDEFEAMIHNPALGPPVFGLLRSLANTHPVALVTASRRELAHFCQTPELTGSSFFNIFTTVPLGLLLEHEARQVIGEPSAVAGRPLGAYADDLLSMSGRHPLFLQIACSAAYDGLCAEEDHLD